MPVDEVVSFVRQVEQLEHVIYDLSQFDNTDPEDDEPAGFKP